MNNDTWLCVVVKNEEGWYLNLVSIRNSDFTPTLEWVLQIKEYFESEEIGEILIFHTASADESFTDVDWCDDDDVSDEIKLQFENGNCYFET